MRKTTMQNSLRSISKVLKAHADAHADYVKATDSAMALLGQHVSAISGAAEGDKAVQGYLGHVGKLTKAHSAAMQLCRDAHDGLHDGIGKCIKGMSVAAGVDLSIGNANSTEASCDTTHSGHNTTDPGEIERGLKGATAGDLQKASDVLARPTLFSKVQSMVNTRPNANLSKSTEGGWRPMLEPDHFNGHPTTLSTFEQRKRDGSK